MTPFRPLLSIDSGIIPGILVLFASFTIVSCGRDIPVPEQISFEVESTLPHDTQAFTQGLLIHNDFLYESTGEYGESSLRKIELETGKTLEIRYLPDRLFGEGLAFLDGKLFQLEWQSGVGRICDPETLLKVGEFTYEGEGWGLTTDGTHLILSDGSATLRFLDPKDFTVRRELLVRDRLGEVVDLNELEYVDGVIFANLWYSDEILRIDPETGFVTGILNIGALERPRPRDEAAVANGIAWDPDSGLLYVTGKLWPNLYALRIQKD
ncbi:MAG: glutaminyl-peptide cyclotransferase [Verrucomicrobiota bacterium]